MEYLDIEDKQFFKDHKGSAYHKVYKKALQLEFEKQQNLLMTCSGSEALHRAQGILVGIRRALNIIEAMAEPEDVLPFRPKRQ